MIRATPIGDDQSGGPRDWLERVRGDGEERERFVAEARALVGRLLHAHASATMDPYVPELGPQTASATRVGYGDGEELAAGRWSEAIEAAPDPGPRRRRAEALRPQERLAAVLGGREEIAPHETLVLRARADLDNGRPREAALGLEAAVAALLAELDSDPGSAGTGEGGIAGAGAGGAGGAGADAGGGADAARDEREDLSRLRAQAKALASIRDQALIRTPDDAATGRIRETLEVAERILRRRRILGPR